jgi:hypothetical protein
MPVGFFVANESSIVPQTFKRYTVYSEAKNAMAMVTAINKISRVFFAIRIA